MMCNPPNATCWQGQCNECPDVFNLKETIEEIFYEMDVDNITFKQWESTEKTQLVTPNLTETEFVEELMDKLQVLKLHQFIDNQQTKYFYEVKESLPIGKVLVVGDFSENYSFI